MRAARLVDDRLDDPSAAKWRLCDTARLDLDLADLFASTQDPAAERLSTTEAIVRVQRALRHGCVAVVCC